MKILVRNIGSGSQRCSLFDLPETAVPAEPLDPLWGRNSTRLRPEKSGSRCVATVRPRRRTRSEKSTVAEPTERLLGLLWRGLSAAIPEPKEIEMVGHRVVHGGMEFRTAVRIHAEVEKTIERLKALAPLHNEHNLVGIRVARDVLGERAEHGAVFDTAFHHRLSPAAATYAGPHAWLGLRLDKETNAASPMDADLSTPDSSIRALIVKSREAWQIAREWHALLGGASRGNTSRTPSAKSGDTKSTAVIV
jgi:acetate kinase